MALPTPDMTFTVNMSQTAGKVALVAGTTALSVSCPTGASIIDLVGYGATATCSEGTTAPAPSASTAVLRAGSGCTDVNNNGTDFAVAAPAPRNSATTTLGCNCVVRNKSNAALEADYCNVQSPLSLNLQSGANTGFIYAKLLESGVTELGGASSTVRAQLGYGPASANPQYESSWKWTNASYNAGSGNPVQDEYQAQFTAPASGSYRYAYRFSLDFGVSWTLCDMNANDYGAGSNAGFTFELSDLPVLTVTP